MSRVDQLRALAEEERRWCPECHRVGRRLGDHDCREPLTYQEAQARIGAQGGVLAAVPRRTDVKGAIDTFDGLLDDVADKMGDLAGSIRVGTAAMISLRRAFTEADFPPGTGSLASYKGIPIHEDPALPADAIMALPVDRGRDPAPRAGWDFGCLTGGRRFSAITGLTA